MRYMLRATIALAIVLYCTPVLAGQPQVGDTIPDFTIAPLAVQGDATLLGLEENRPFKLGDIPTPYVIIEIIGVYCPLCHAMAPSLTRLCKRLKKARLDDRVSLLGIAAGGTSMEVQHIRGKDYIFPVAHDTEYDIYGKLGDPKTPFTMLVDREGTILYTYLGIIPDFDAFFREIQALVK
jgi:thiol-disulfide isomerase/thioredoxin